MPNDAPEISADSAFTNAVSFLTIVQRALQRVPSGLEDLFVGEVVNAPTTIFDLNETQLFYDFPVALNARRVGSVRVAATKLLGNPWIAVQQALPLDTASALQQATTLLASAMPGSGILESKPVCYLYPSVGLFIRIKQASGNQVVRILVPEDSRHPLIEIPEGAIDLGPDHVEGAAVYSILEALPEGGDPGAEFDRFDQLTNSIVAEFETNRPGTPGKPRHEQVKEAFIWNAQNRPEGETTEKILTVKQIPQDPGSEFCVLACIQMIADFWQVGQPLSQSEMAQQLEEPPALFTLDSGILPNNQAAAFQRFFPPGFQITFDQTPEWQKFVDAIQAGRPFKSGITAHARVAVGYQVLPIGPVAPGSDTQLQRSLWINDPAKSAGMMFEPHEIATLDPADSTRVLSVTPRIPFKNNSVLVSKEA
jgi:hypothetical protein